MTDLKKLTKNNETLAGFWTSETPRYRGGRVIYTMIVDAHTPVKKQDIQECMNITLNRLLEKEASDKDIEYILFATKTPPLPPNDYIELDHGYVIPGRLLGYDGESQHFSRWR